MIETLVAPAGLSLNPLMGLDQLSSKFSIDEFVVNLLSRTKLSI